MSPPPVASPSVPLRQRLSGALALFGQLPRTFRLFWEVAPWGAAVLGALTLVSALLPAAIAWVGKLIIDAVVLAAREGSEAARTQVLHLVGLELVLSVAVAAVTRLNGYVRELLRAQLGNDINGRILEKALQLELRHFEDADTYDKMQNARREASSRPLSLVLQVFAIAQNVITLASFAVLLIRLSPWSVLILVLASIPAFVAEARMAGDSFRLYSWRAPEGRKLNYL
ncbi:MAG: ABC transporter ATP-binding protein, partial [Myxococcaceae bacterium]|nr:ABC transporter ATP-binding protein [Myxococcaceae bacterium]